MISVPFYCQLSSKCTKIQRTNLGRLVHLLRESSRVVVDRSEFGREERISGTKEITKADVSSLFERRNELSRRREVD